MNNTHSDRPSYRGAHSGSEHRHSTSPRPDSPPLPAWVQAFRRRRRTERRGVLLLLMLSLLVLFAVVGVTYVLLSSQFRRSAAGPARLEQYAVDSAKQLDEAAMQVFRGSSSPLSVLSIHSLLEDLNGNDAVASMPTSFTTGSASTFGTPNTISSAAISLSNQNSLTYNNTKAPNATTQVQLVDLTLLHPLPWPLSTNTAAQTAVNLFGVPTALNSPYKGYTDANGSAPSGFYNGCLLTFTTGPAAGQSTRIIGYDNGYTTSPNTGTSQTNSTGTTILRVMGFPGATALIGAGAGPNGWQFLINGRPFNGTGFGFNFSTNLVDAVDNTPSAPPIGPRLFALLPNPVFFSNTYPSGNPASAYNVPGGVGGADEDYDAADWNNMLLGLPLDPRDVTGSPPTIPVTAHYPPYPSLHRPELVQFWMNNVAPGSANFSQFLLATSSSGSNSANLALARQAMLRPIGYAGPDPAGKGIVVDHPNFTGSNANPNTDIRVAAAGFDPVNGPYDVDTDGDGIADSVWVDLGLPVQTAPDGTTYKPLFAIRVLDMDGRLNVNAHGNSAQVETAYTSPTAIPAVTSANPTPVPGSTVTFAGETGNSLLPSTVGAPNVQYPTPGSGYGTAEINLQPLFNEQGLSATQYQQLLAGNTAAGYEGRYGESTSTAPTANYNSTVVPSNTTPPYPGVTNSGDVEVTASTLGLIKHWEFPFPGTVNGVSCATMLTAYGSAPDLSGRSFTALDIGGAPLMPSMSAVPFESPFGAWAGGLGGPYDTLNNPYTLNLSRTAVRSAKATGATDNPFTPAELERILRSNDADVGSLPPRLAALLGATSPPAATPTAALAAIALLRRQVTTDSWDLPSPNLLTTSTSLASLIALPPPFNVTQPFPLPFNSSAADLLLAHLKPNFPDLMLSTRHPEWNNIPIQLQLMLPPELLNGQRFDINRPFGNGRDDDGDGVVDEPDEYQYGEPAWISPGATPSTTPPFNAGNSPFPNNTGTTNAINLAVDWNGDGTIDINDALMVRHLMARHLYVLAMMVLDAGFNNDSPGAPWGQQNSIQYDPDGISPFYVGDENVYQIQYALAQWAINCVDFRDRDSVMTPFEFDINPLDGWSVDGVVGNGSTDDNDLPALGQGRRGLVWGCERPELLITETLAWHDRRTQDLTVDGGTYASGNDTNKDFDQALLPMPACFIELYNPWTTQYSNLNTTAGEKQNAPAAAEVPGEFYYDKNSSNAAYKPYTSYPTAQQPTGVILNKLDTSGKSPVWRLIFVNDGLKTGPTPILGPATPDARIVDPDDPMLLAPSANTLNFNNYIDRIAYFVAPPAGLPAAGFPTFGGMPSQYCTVYYPSSGQPQATLKPGRYAVVGSAGGDQYTDPVSGTPAPVSKLGRMAVNTGDSSNPAMAISADTNAIRIVLTPKASSETNQVVIYNNNQTATEPGPILGGNTTQDAQNAIAIALDTAIPPGGMPGPRSFGISDPVGGYNVPLNGYNGAGEPQLQTVALQPLDATAIAPATAGDQQMMTNQTLYGYRTVHLQRLANPDIKWDAITNPYLTIDSASVDVTAFNGVSPTQDPPFGAATGNQAIQSTPFCSTQRGDQYAATAPVTQTGQVNLLWAREYGHSPTGTGVLSQPAVPLATSVFPLALSHSLGYLNQMYGIASATAVPTYTAKANTAYTSTTLSGAYKSPSAYLGMPITGNGLPNVNSPFPWLTWNNRPYTTPLELALVPKSRSSRLLSDISNGPTTTAGTGLSIYNSQSGGVVLYPNLPTVGGASFIDPVAINGGTATTPFFGHLLNFFDAGQPNPVNNSMPGNHPPANLYRLFEYLQVPSRFVGTETVLSPVGANYGNMNSTGSQVAATSVKPTLLYGDAVPGGTPPTWMASVSASPANPVYTLASSPMGTYLRPPLNKVSEYRDPGRVNINTVQDAAVWQGVLNGSFYPQLAPLSGAPGTTPNIAATVATQMNPTYTPAFGVGSGVAGVPVPTATPSYFANPFRSYSGAALTNSIYGPPSGTGLQPYPNALGVFNNPNPGTMPLRDIDVTLLRPAQFGAAAGVNPPIPALFDAQPIASNTAALPFNDPVRSPFFRFQNASRMSNLLTTHSNVYAVWITVGYFQVTPWYGVTVPGGVVTYGTSATGPVVYDTAHQDGYQLGQELGSDTGQIKRHRAFYIFDRTIPVGFERGVDHNVKDAILLRRYIE